MPVNKVRRNGSFAPLSAHYYKDDAIAEAGEAAELLYVRGLAFCADVLSDGFVSDVQLTRFPGVGMRDATKRAKRLVEVGLWERVGGGYRVKSWLLWNRSSEEIKELTSKDRERKTPRPSGSDDEPPPDSDKLPNGNRAESEAGAERNPNGFQPRARAPLHSTPSKEEPPPTPPASDSDFLITADAAIGGIETDFETWWAQWPRKIAKPKALAAYRTARKKKITAERLLATAAAQLDAWRAAGRAKDKIPHATTWLNQERWNDEVETPKFTVINNPESPWDGYRIDTSESPWAADMGWTS